MLPAGGIPKVLAEEREHGVQNFRRDRGGGVVVEVDQLITDYGLRITDYELRMFHGVALILSRKPHSST